MAHRKTRYITRIYDYNYVMLLYKSQCSLVITIYGVVVLTTAVAWELHYGKFHRNAMHIVGKENG